MKDRSSNMPSVDQQALEWLNSLPDSHESAREAFGVWALRSPANLNAFLKHKALGTELQGLDPQETIDVNSLLMRAKENTKVVPWPAAASEEIAFVEGPVRLRSAAISTPRMRRHWIAAAAAILTFLSSAQLWHTYLFFPLHSTMYATSTGQQERIVLRDGSIIELNTESSVRVDFSRTARDVYLLGGEAMFDVKHNAAVPFRVHAKGTLIEDLGTQFSVNQRSDATNVAVIEGFVQVSSERHGKTSFLTGGSWTGEIPDVVVTTKEFEPLRHPTRVSAGEQASIVADGTLMQKGPVNIAQATAWRRGRVAFSGATLDEIVAEFNRYNVRKIHIHGDALRERRYTGRFDAHDPESFIDYLREDAGIEIEDNKDGLVLRNH